MVYIAIVALRRLPAQLPTRSGSTSSTIVEICIGRNRLACTSKTVFEAMGESMKEKRATVGDEATREASSEVCDAG